MYKFCYTSLKLTVTDGKDCSMEKKFVDVFPSYIGEISVYDALN